nr:hypothetical protein [Tanacetum cinerariifolium]
MRTAWNEFSCSMASDVICLATVDDLTFHNTHYTSPALTQEVFANMRRVGKGFLGVETPLFASMLVPPQPQAAEEGEEVEMPTAPAPPSSTNAPSPSQDPTPTPHATPPQDQPSTPPASPVQEQPTTTTESSMSLLTTLMETCASLSQKVVELEQDKHTQALDILQLKKRVKKLEKKKRSKHSGMHPNKWKIEAIDADEDITLVDVDTQEEVVTMDVELQGRINQEDVSAATKDVSVAEPTVFNDEKVIMSMARTSIKLKAKKAKLLDEQIAQKLDDEEVKKAAAMDKQEKDDLERAQVLQKQYDDKEENIDWSAVVDQVQERHLDNIRKYQSLKKKPVFIAQARKNMIIYLKNMAGYQMEHFIGMTYDKAMPVFEREYKRV